MQMRNSGVRAGAGDAAPRANHIYRRAAWPGMVAMAQKGGQSLVDARTVAAGARRGARQDAAQAADADGKLFEVVDKWIEHLSHPAPTPELQKAREEELNKELDKELDKDLSKQISEDMRKERQRERQDPKRIAADRYRDNTIAVGEDSRRTTILDIEWYDAGLTYADLYPKKYAGINIKAPVDPLPYFGPDEIRVVKKGSCTCMQCGCAGLDPI